MNAPAGVIVRAGDVFPELGAVHIKRYGPNGTYEHHGILCYHMRDGQRHDSFVIHYWTHEREAMSAFKSSVVCATSLAEFLCQGTRALDPQPTVTMEHPVNRGEGHHGDHDGRAAGYVVVNHADEDPFLTYTRAFHALGEQSYSLFGNNCEHFARWCVTGQRHSTQIQVLRDYAHSGLVYLLAFLGFCSDAHQQIQIAHGLVTTAMRGGAWQGFTACVRVLGAGGAVAQAILELIGAQYEVSARQRSSRAIAAACLLPISFLFLTPALSSSVAITCMTALAFADARWNLRLGFANWLLNRFPAIEEILHDFWCGPSQSDFTHIGFSYEDAVQEAARFLGLASEFTASGVRRAFRRKALQYHPDRGGDLRLFHKAQYAMWFLDEHAESGRTSDSIRWARSFLDLHASVDQHMDPVASLGNGSGVVHRIRRRVPQGQEYRASVRIDGGSVYSISAWLDQPLPCSWISLTVVAETTLLLECDVLFSHFSSNPVEHQVIAPPGCHQFEVQATCVYYGSQLLSYLGAEDIGSSTLCLQITRDSAE